MKTDRGTHIALRARLAAFNNSARKALRDVLPVWLALALLTTLPYVLAALGTPPGHAFPGVLTAYDDTFTYLAWMRQGAEGHLLMCDRFTSEPQSCEFFLPLWGALGLLSRITAAPLIMIFHAARLLSGLLLLLVARQVARTAMSSRTRIRYTLWMYGMSGGLGWLVYALNNRGSLMAATVTTGSSDLYLPEALLFRSVFAQVHFSLGAALTCGAILLVFNALADRRANRAFLAGGATSLLAVVHPYMVVVVFAVAAAAILSWPWLGDKGAGPRDRLVSCARTALWACASSLPGIAYLIYLSRTNTVLREWLRITDTLSPAPVEYILGFGIIGALALPGAGLLLKMRGRIGRLFLIWLLVHCALLYAPVSFQRRLVEGLQLPLVVAASVSLFWAVGKIRWKRATMRLRKVMLTSVIVFASLTNLGFVAGQVLSRGQDQTSKDPRRYAPGSLVAAFRWLEANAEPDAVILSSYLTGNLAPSMTGLNVYLGHYGMTINSPEKGERVAAFYSGALPEHLATNLFGEHRIIYVIYGPFEHALAPQFAAPSWLRLAYRDGDVEVFKVVGQRED